MDMIWGDMQSSPSSRLRRLMMSATTCACMGARKHVRAAWAGMRTAGSTPLPVPTWKHTDKPHNHPREDLVQAPRPCLHACIQNPGQPPAPTHPGQDLLLHAVVLHHGRLPARLVGGIRGRHLRTAGSKPSHSCTEASYTSHALERDAGQGRSQGSRQGRRWCAAHCQSHACGGHEAAPGMDQSIICGFTLPEPKRALLSATGTWGVRMLRRATSCRWKATSSRSRPPWVGEE